MMHKHLLTLLQTGYKTIEVCFKDAHDLNPRTKRYTYKARIEDDVKVDNVVIVDSPANGLSLCVVVAVHEVPKLDLDAPFEYKWIVQKVDRTAYDTAMAKEEEFRAVMQEVERLRQRELLMKQFTDHLPEGSEARKLFDSAISNVTGIPALEVTA